MSTPKKKKKKQPEFELQYRVVEHCRKSDNPILQNIFAPMVGYNLQTIGLKVKAKRLGSMAGVSDLCLFMRGKTLWLELKSPKGHLNASQKVFRDYVRSLGHQYEVVRDFETAVRLLQIAVDKDPALEYCIQQTTQRSCLK